MSEKPSLAMRELHNELEQVMKTPIENPGRWPVLGLTKGEKTLLLKTNPEGFFNALPPGMQRCLELTYDYYNLIGKLDEFNPFLREIIEARRY